MKTGLFFGSFNPVHIGHMAIANYIVEHTDLKQIWFVVSPHNPLKEKKTLLADVHRLRLVKEAIGEDRRFKASSVEFKLPQPSYTIDTLTHLKEKHPEKEFVLILGSDNVQTLNKWKNYREILKQYEIIVYPRTNRDNGSEQDSKAMNAVPEQIGTILEAPLMEISSSFIREAIRAKKDVRHFVPAAVWTYIQEMNFYKK